ncbi:MAG TPA: hypothetical protein VM493_08720, partial [Vicinamibacterales bacterium]|nr:hypothetical protein [Vicinamibacterales bacterium]
MAGVDKYLWLPDEQLVEVCAEHDTNDLASEDPRINVPTNTLTSRLRRRKLQGAVQARRRKRLGARPTNQEKQPGERPGLTVRGDNATIVTPPAPDLG